MPPENPKGVSGVMGLDSRQSTCSSAPVSYQPFWQASWGRTQLRLFKLKGEQKEEEEKERWEEGSQTRKGPIEWDKRQGKGSGLKRQALCKEVMGIPLPIPQASWVSAQPPMQALTGKLDHRSLAGHYSKGAMGQAGIAALNDCDGPRGSLITVVRC